MTSPPPSPDALLDELAASSEPVSLPRLCKRLGLPMSTLLRMLAALDDSVIGDRAGPGHVVVEDDGERRLARITEAGRAWLAAGNRPD